MSNLRAVSDQCWAVRLKARLAVLLTMSKYKPQSLHEYIMCHHTSTSGAGQMRPGGLATEWSRSVKQEQHSVSSNLHFGWPDKSSRCKLLQGSQLRSKVCTCWRAQLLLHQNHLLRSPSYPISQWIPWDLWQLTALMSLEKKMLPVQKKKKAGKKLLHPKTFKYTFRCECFSCQIQELTALTCIHSIGWEFTDWMWMFETSTSSNSQPRTSVMSRGPNSLISSIRRQRGPEAERPGVLSSAVILPSCRILPLILERLSSFSMKKNRNPTNPTCWIRHQFGSAQTSHWVGI